MAYRTRRTRSSSAYGRRRTAGVARSRRSYSSRGGRRVSRGSRSTGQTVRVVIEQAPPPAVARGPISAEGLMQVEAPKKQKAKF